MKRFKLLLTALMLVAVITLYLGCPMEAEINAGTRLLTAIEVTGDTFSMGPADVEWDNRAQPAHNVTVPTFYMSKYEITQQQWINEMGTWPANAPSGTLGFDGDHPMQYVTWYDAVEFCNALSVKNGRALCYTIDKVTDPNNTSTSDTVRWTVTMDTSANGFRLPTEAEWEYAAGGGATNRTTYAGTSDVKLLGNYAWYRANSGDVAHTVGTKTANTLGLFDMSGNVWEWCWDWYAPYTTLPDPQPNPADPLKGEIRILRGGGFTDSDVRLKVANRYAGIPSYSHMTFGFRVVSNATWTPIAP